MNGHEDRYTDKKGERHFLWLTSSLPERETDSLMTDRQKIDGLMWRPSSTRQNTRWTYWRKSDRLKVRHRDRQTARDINEYKLVLFSSLLRLWKHRSTIQRRKSFLYRLRSNRRSLHHAGPDGVCTAPHGAVYPHACGVLATAVRLASSQRRQPALYSHDAAGHRSVLPASCWCFQHLRGVLVISGGVLFLLHLPLHHRLRRLRTRGAAKPETPTFLQDLGYG